MSEAFERAVTALRLASALPRNPTLTAADLAPLETLAPGIGAMYRRHVRAVLEAIRDPDGAMIDAGAATYGIGDGVIGPLPASALEGQPSKSWRAMIDEMLCDV